MGIGRTGHFILMLELMKLFFEPDFFIKNKTSDQILEVCLAKLEQIRKDRPGLVNLHVQFKYAIRNAFAMFQYALKNQLVDVKEYENIIELALPKSTLATKTPEVTTASFKPSI